MNGNCFTLTRREFLLLAIRSRPESLCGFEEDIAGIDRERLEHGLETLESKGYITATEDERVKTNPQLAAWVHVATHPLAYFCAQCIDGRKLHLYFLADSIVSISETGDELELIWLPFIHLAIGQLGGMLENSDPARWRFSSLRTDTDETSEYIPSEGEDITTVVNNASGIFVPLHGQAIERRTI